MPKCNGHTKRIEVFRPGTFKAMDGQEFTATADDLIDLAGRYDPENNPVPVVVGHPDTDHPAYGWVKEFSYNKENERLEAEIGDLDPKFVEAVTDGKYKRISMAYFNPGASSNPAGDKLYPKHVGFLGAKPPAVSGLKPVQFNGSAEDYTTVELAEPALNDVGSIFQSIRDFFIEKFGLDVADRVVPTWKVEWIKDAAHEKPDGPTTSSFADNPDENLEKREPVMPLEDKKKNGNSDTSNGDTSISDTSAIGTDDTKFAEREASLDEREAEINKREQEQRHKTHVEFAEGLVKQGKLPSGHKEKVVVLLDGMAEQQSGSVSFAEGNETKEATPSELMSEILGSLPTIVNFGETDLGDAPETIKEDPEQIAAEAVKFQTEQRNSGIEISTSQAVEHVMKQLAS